MQHARAQRRKPIEATPLIPVAAAGTASPTEADVLAQPKPADPNGGPGHDFSKLRVLPGPLAAQPASAVLQALPDLGAAPVAGDRLQLAEGEQSQGDVETVTTALGRALGDRVDMAIAERRAGGPGVPTVGWLRRGGAHPSRSPCQWRAPRDLECFGTR